jgi:hypothetical protein
MTGEHPRTEQKSAHQQPLSMAKILSLPATNCSAHHAQRPSSKAYMQAAL